MDKLPAVKIPTQDSRATAFGGWVAQCRQNILECKWWVEKGRHGLPGNGHQSKAPPSRLAPTPKQRACKPLLQTTQDVASLSPKSGFESQKETKLPLLSLSQGGRSLKPGAVTMTMNMLASSTKALRSRSSKVPRTSRHPGAKAK